MSPNEEEGKDSEKPIRKKGWILLAEKPTSFTIEA